MKLHAFLAGSFVVTAALLAGCSSDGGGSSSAPPAVFCTSAFAGTSVCYGYTNLTADQQKSVSDACTAAPLSGKVVSTCPTADLVGCCKYTAAGIATEECYYGGGDAGIGDPTAAAKQACTGISGTWSTGQ